MGVCVCMCVCAYTYDQIELPAKLLDYFLWSDKNNIIKTEDWCLCDKGEREREKENGREDEKRKGRG